MNINKKNRTELKQYFIAEAQPTEKQFSDFVDATVNQAEDGIAKVPGNPVSIEAEGEVVSTQEVLHFYSDFNQEIPNWGINLNPRVVSEEADSSQAGFNLKDATGESRFFIQSSKGNVGIGSIEPDSKLTIEGKNENSLLSVIDSTQKRTKVFEVSQENGKGKLIVRNGEAAKELSLNSNSIAFADTKDSVNSKMVALEAEEKELRITAAAVKISGTVAMSNLSVNTALEQNGASSDTEIPSQKAVKTYVDTRLPKGLISMWSGAEIPVGWALCDGTNGTPNLSGRFIVGLNAATTDYNQVGKTGGLQEVSLTVNELPAHKHTGTTSKNGSHTHKVSHRASGNDSGNGLSTVTMDGETHGTLNMTTDPAGNHTHSFTSNNTGGNQAHENRPPYFVLAYIMKL